ncbi:MAG: leucine--tRNA ligase [Nitrososphaerota archaeon]|jgi:leucyl-tRNA synthetase|nr:leucine--tRNA ligase [Nitrososphaerota archaeon]MDG6903933.1 leucine--tRNA ligase [Nitrososphaerota archaeon]MDG6912706.1 leucine--tRNA ligase [Nitrososphaerota archaeon]MDG6919154.1 leucine--tRNA ligase [Nitrososphaerota archaeon]MDG6921334.1 leucine--tRNA ligase [Nitrososphaerota archaeon]
MSAREKHWLKVWDEKHAFEPDPVAGKKKVFVTFPFPYMNAAVHVGTAFTASHLEFYSRFKRLQGYNVLFPWAWHWTGQPIVGMSKRLREGDPDVRRAFLELDHVPEQEVAKFVDPEYLASYYTKQSRKVMKETGFSIDWRREFRTIDPAFRKFVEWQYFHLREMGYVVQGTHPVVWCPFDKSPTGDHDRMEGEGVSPTEFNLIKFHLGEFALVAATLRPETIYGATNVWVNPDADYSEARVDGELWIVSSASLSKLSEQKHNVVPVREFKGSDLVGRYAMAPLTGKSLPVFPGRFVDPSLATGVVYSVPAHAPYDLMALRDIQEGRVQVGRQVKEEADKITPIPILSLSGYSRVPAEDAIRKLSIKDSMDPNLETATQEIYSAEFHRGVLSQSSGPLADLTVPEAKDKAVELIAKTERLAKMFELPEKVVCRCGTRCYVKILENQWFLNYSNPEWKAKAKLVIDRAEIYPEEARQLFYSTIEWLKDWPCARRSGMGTRLPWDKDWLVETLSDSTIYMAYYCISKFVNLEKVGPDSLTPEVLDYVLLGKGSPANLAKAARIPERVLRDLRTEFSYWYPVDLRNSGKDLIPNHLTFFAFHHAALFPEKFWPRGFGINGMITIEGKRMSKTKGNFVTWEGAKEKYGADAFRLALALTADGMDDADWRDRAAMDAKEKVDSVIPFVKKTLRSSADRKADGLDSWLVSSFNGRIAVASEAMEELRMRRASATVFLDIWNDLRYYLRRAGKPRRQTLTEVFNAWARMMSPFTPFMAEELNRELGGKGLVCQADWPAPDDFPVDDDAVLAEAVLGRVIEDARNVLKVVKGARSKLNVYVCSDEAKAFFLELTAAKQSKGNVGQVLKKHASLKIQPDRVFKLAYELGEDLLGKVVAGRGFDEFQSLSEASEFMAKELGIEVVVQKTGKQIHDPANRAKDALPTKPAFYLE